MSPRLGSRQRGAIGLMAALLLGLALVFLLLVIDSGRLYLEKRKLQGIADMAALEAVQRNGDCLAANNNTATTYAGASALRNGYATPPGNALIVRCGTLATAASNLRVFTPNAAQRDAIEVTASRPVLTSVAGGVWSLAKGGAYNLTTLLTAKAVAAPKILPPQAQLTIKSTLVTVNSSNAAAMNLVFSKLLGGGLSLDVAGWQGLVDNNINVLSYLNQLALNVGVQAGNYDELLAKNLKLGQLIDAAVTVLQAGSGTASVAASGLAGIGTLAGNLDVTLGSLLQLQTGAASAGLNTTLNAFQLAEAFVQLANKTSGVVADVPVTLPGVSANVKIRVIQPPQLSAIGDPTYAKNKTDASTRIYVRTAQVNVGLTVGLPVLNTAAVNTVLNALVSPLTTALNNLLSLNLAGTVSSVLCAVGGVPCQTTDLRLLSSATNPSISSVDLILELGGAESYVTGFTCASDATKTLVTQTNSAPVSIKVGQSPTLINSLGASPPLASVPPLPIVDIGAVTCLKPVLGLGPTVCDYANRKAFYGGGIGLLIDSTLGVIPASGSAYTYNQPPEIKQPPLYHSLSTPNLVTSLKQALQTGLKFQVYKPTGSNLLGGLLATSATLLNDLNGTLGSLVGSVLGPVVDPLVNGLLSNLGVNLNQVEIGANLSCRPHGQSALVI
ncbi:pilus assembly protein TadG-related protein [Pseudomonas fluorescens]|uniref:pilus assembly protein TadG-related protein n=1 Tax=Pseudomonas fluorescens TaxID=294 RepID=UPI00037DC419|nr:pilus assembly protein TadG-related protein [Pseudomonas fluorescens]